MLEGRVTATVAAQQQQAAVQTAAPPVQQNPTVVDLASRLAALEGLIHGLVDRFNGINVATGDFGARIDRAETSLRFLNDRIDSTDGLA